MFAANRLMKLTDKSLALRCWSVSYIEKLSSMGSFTNGDAIFQEKKCFYTRWSAPVQVMFLGLFWQPQFNHNILLLKHCKHCFVSFAYALIYIPKMDIVLNLMHQIQNVVVLIKFKYSIVNL